MPAAQLKFVIISAIFLLGFSPLFANADKLEDREAPAVQDWVRDDTGNGDPLAGSGAGSSKPERRGDAYTGDATGDPVRDRPAGAIKTLEYVAVEGDGAPVAGVKPSETSEKKDAGAPNSEKAPGSTDIRGASGDDETNTAGTAATDPAKFPVAKPPAAKRDSDPGSPKVAAGEDDKDREIVDAAGDTGTSENRAAESRVSGENPNDEKTAAKDSGGPSSAKKRIPDNDREADQAVPDRQEAEISREDPMDRKGDQDPDGKAGVSPPNKPGRKGAVDNTVVGKAAAEAPNSAREIIDGKIGSTGDEVFPSSPGIDRQKEFWILIFTRYTSQQGVLHDRKIATPIFRELDLMGMAPRAQARYIKNGKRQLAVDLKILAEASRNGSKLTEKQLALKSKMPKGVTPEAIVRYARNIHFQRGLSDRFQEGIIRSGALMEMMRRTMARYGLPEDLVYLPHVESSFVNATLSRSGARGIWQFTRDTGRRYMRVGYLVDQRLDPVVATRSAARFLRRYQKQLKSWPLTISAYNHGPEGIKRLIRKMGTRDLGVMIRDYEGPWFRFASKNFYAEFLAAREIAKNYRRYFGELKMDRPTRYASAKVPFYVLARDAARALRISERRFRWMNPALRGPIWKGIKRIPKGYVLNIPIQQDPLRFIAAIPKSARYKRQQPTSMVRVRRGDTLIRIGRRYGIPWRRIAAANNIRRGRIRRGQRLLLPLEKSRLARNAAVAKVVTQQRKTAVKTSGVKITAGKTTAGTPTLPSTPPGKSNPVLSSGNAGAVVSNPPATRPSAKTGTRPNATVSIGRGDAGGQGATGTNDLAMVNFDAKNNIGRIVAVFGESLGHYAEWGNVSARRLRRLNGFSYRRKIRNGEYLLVYLDGVDPETFTQRRVKFHQKLAITFFAENNITQRRLVEVKRGQSAWMLARKNNVPLWLFFRENPGLLGNPMRIGMEVVVPVVEAAPSR